MRQLTIEELETHKPCPHCGLWKHQNQWPQHVRGCEDGPGQTETWSPGGNHA
jgi:hypothetical protein